MDDRPSQCMLRTQLANGLEAAIGVVLGDI